MCQWPLFSMSLPAVCPSIRIARLRSVIRVYPIFREPEIDLYSQFLTHCENTTPVGGRLSSLHIADIEVARADHCPQIILADRLLFAAFFNKCSSLQGAAYTAHPLSAVLPPLANVLHFVGHFCL